MKSDLYKSTLRAFLAISLQPDIQLLFETIQHQLRASFTRSKVLWVNPKNIHLTIAFLGDIFQEQTNELTRQCRLIRLAPFELKISSAGAFPNWKNPKVLWVGYEESSPLKKLQEEIRSILAKLGIPIEEKPYRAHVTLGRVKEFHDNGAAIGVPKAVQFVDAFSLFQSELTRSGPIYKLLQKFPLYEDR